MCSMAIFFSPAREAPFPKAKRKLKTGDDGPEVLTVSQAMRPIRLQCVAFRSIAAVAGCERKSLRHLVFGDARGVAVGRKGIVETYAPEGHVIKFPIDYDKKRPAKDLDSRFIVLLPAASDVR